MGYELHEAETLYSWLLHSEGDWQPCKLNTSWNKTIITSPQLTLPHQVIYSNLKSDTHGGSFNTKFKSTSSAIDAIDDPPHTTNQMGEVKETTELRK